MKRTPEDPASEQTTSPSPIIKKYFQEKMKQAGAELGQAQCKIC